MGAQRAAWQMAFRTESAALTSKAYAQSLLDLVKAFGKIPHFVVPDHVNQQRIMWTWIRHLIVHLVLFAVL